MPLTRRLPKRGFTPPFRVENQVVALEDLARVPAGTEITHESLAAAGLIQGNKGPAKLLANGEVTQAVTVRGIKMSVGAREKIVAAGGSVAGEEQKKAKKVQGKGTEAKRAEGKGTEAKATEE